MNDRSNPSATTVGAETEGMLKREDVKVGIFWRVIEVSGAEFFAFCSFLVLTRMLAPESFGIVTLATMLIMVAQLMLYHGVGEALVQRDKIDNDYFSSGLWMNFSIATVSMAVLMLASNWIALGFAEPQFGPVLRAIAPILLIYAISGVLQAKLRRDLKLKGFAIASIAATICGAIVASLLALFGFEVWSLVGQQWTYATVSTVIFFFCAGWTPRLYVAGEHVRALAGFSINAVGATLLRFSLRQTDLLFLGIHLTAREVGLYFLASRILFTIGQFTYYSIQKISLPVLARMQNDPDHHQSAINPTFRLTCLICLPVFFGMAVTADLAVPLIFGTEWSGSIPVFQIMCCFSIFYALSLIINQVLLSVGFASIVLRLSIFNAVLMLIAVGFAAPHGIVATVIASGLANTLALPAYALALRQWLNVDLLRLAKELFPIWIAAAAMVGMVIMVRLYVVSGWHELTMLVVSVAIGAIVFGISVLVLCRDYTMELLTIVFGRPQISSDNP